MAAPKLFKPDSPVVAKVIPAMYFGPRAGTRPTAIVLHSAETSEVTNSAEGTAGYFRGGSGGRPASAHYCVDIDGVVQCVREADRAFGAPYANYWAIHIEQAGRADQTKAQWHDSYSTAMVANQVVPLVADICKRHVIRPRELTVEMLVHGERSGICTHATLTAWCKRIGKKTNGHTDPGKDYPLDFVIEQVSRRLAR